jgi:hypothetical protein
MCCHGIPEMVTLAGMDADAWLGEEVFNLGDARMRLTFGLVSGRIEVVGLELWSADPRTQPENWGRYDPRQMKGKDNNFDVKREGPIATVDLRGIALQGLVNDWLNENAQTVQMILDSPRAPAEWQRRVRKSQKQLAEASVGRRGRKPQYGLEHFEAVANVYRKAQMQRKPPTEAVAEWGNVNTSTAAKWVSRARNEYGLLPKTTQGRAASENAPSRRRTSKR